MLHHFAWEKITALSENLREHWITLGKPAQSKDGISTPPICQQDYQLYPHVTVQALYSDWEILFKITGISKLSQFVQQALICIT